MPRLPPRLLAAAFAAGLFALIVGAKWATFDRFGSPMPDWDQWDAEGYYALIPWFERKPMLPNLLEPHNEHRVVLTRLQNLALTLAAGQWDARLQAASNALLHAAFAAALWLAARRWVAARWHAALFALAFALFGLPLAWQNVLGGFHSQQYWLLATSVLAIVTLPFARAWGAAWWLGVGAAVLALGSMGSGLFAPFTVLLVLAWRLARREATLRAAGPTLAVCAALVAVGFATRVEVGHHAHMKVKTVHDFFLSILRSLEWPLRGREWSGPLLWLPWALAAWRVFTGAAAPPPRSASFRGADAATSTHRAHAGPIIVALGGWTLLQIVATAYARGAGASHPASRYMDTLAFGVFANALALAWLLSEPLSRRTRHAVIASAVAWLGLAGLGIRESAERSIFLEMPDAKRYYTKAEAGLRNYLATDDPRQLPVSPDLPYPSAGGLIDYLTHRSLRPLLPVPLRAPLPLAPAGGSEAFAENDARGADREHPPRRGLPRALAPLEAARTWGSFHPSPATTGVWRSAPLAPSPLGCLKFETAGDLGRPGAGVSLALRDAQSGALLATVVPGKVPGDTWRAAYVRTPRGPFVVEARDDSAAHWLAFSGPVELGAPAYWAWRATKHGLLIVWCAAGATLALALVAWRAGRLEE
jgi:hypothetical protein